MNKEDKKLQKHLVDEMMKVSQTNPDVMYYMEVLMKSYEKLEQKLERYKNIIDEFDKWLLGEQMMFYKGSDGERLIRYGETKKVWLELKGK